MAGRKEHEVLFVLNAALNGNFKGAFSSAQTEFVKLGREGLVYLLDEILSPGGT